MEYEISNVNGDDFGDKQWRYFVKVFKNNKVIWTDYFRTKPTISELNNLTKEME